MESVDENGGNCSHAIACPEAQTYSALGEETLMGRKFSSADEVDEYVRKKEENEYIQLWKYKTRTIESARRKNIRRHIKDELKYYELEYRCIHGDSRKSTSKGQRPGQKTYRQDCPFKMKFKVSKDGCYLEIAEYNNHHNHAHTKEIYSFLPRQRKLDEPTKDLTKQLLRLRANKKLIQAELLPKAKITLKDLHNLASSSSDAPSLEGTLKYLLEKDSNVIELVRSEDNRLLGIFYQDIEMRRTYSSYPEVIFVDAIHKVSNLRAPLYIWAVEDGNGETEIVCFFLALSEDYDTIQKMVQIFKKNNASWIKTRCIMTDKDFTERKAFKVEIPVASLLICRFHVLRTFRREITTEKLGITTGEKIVCLELAQKIVYSNNENDYNSTYDEILDTKIKSFINYFEKNWHNIKEEWVTSLNKNFNMQNTTNNRLEALNSKVVQVVKRHTNLVDMFKDLDTLLLSLRTERDSRAALTQLKKPLDIVIRCDDEKKYLKILTPYAFSFVKQKFDQVSTVKFMCDTIGDIAEVNSREGLLRVTVDNCTCSFYLNMNLPCQHILKLRTLKYITLFSEELIAARWTKNFYMGHSRLAIHTGVENPYVVENNATVHTVQTKKILSQHEKFQMVARKTQKIAALTSEAPSRVFPQRLRILENLIDMWEKNIEVSLLPLQHNEAEITSRLTDNATNNNIPYTEIGTMSHTDSKAELLENFAQHKNQDPVTITLSHALIDHDYYETEKNSHIQIESDNDEHIAEFPSFNDKSNFVGTLDSTSELPLLPQTMKKRGRPKGIDKTVIGLPIKKDSKKPLTFDKKTSIEKDRSILSFFLSTSNTMNAMSGTLINEKDIEMNPNMVSASCLNDNVSISRIRKYFSLDGWSVLQNLIKVKKNNPVWFCHLCKEETVNVDSICCNSCLQCFHLRCVGLTVKQKKKQWFCRSCYSMTSEVIVRI